MIYERNPYLHTFFYFYFNRLKLFINYILHKKHLTKYIKLTKPHWPTYKKCMIFLIIIFKYL